MNARRDVARKTAVLQAGDFQLYGWARLLTLFSWLSHMTESRDPP